MKNKHFAPLLVGIFALTALAFTMAAGVTLKLKPQQGKTYTISTKTNMVMNIEVQGQTMNQSQTMEVRQIFTPTQVTDDQTVAETQIDAVKFSTSQMGMKFESDSDHPEKTSPMLAGQTNEIQQSIKKPVTITYDAFGNLVGDSISLTMNQLGNVIIELPKEELSVGSKWNHEKTQSISGIEVKANLEYTVTAITKKSVDVSFAGNINSEEMNGTYSGTASIDPKTGLMMSSTTDSNISMTITEQGMTLPITMAGTTTIEVK